MAIKIAKDPESGNRDYTPCPEGVYDLEVEDVKIDTSKNENKTQRLSLKCKIVSGPARVGNTCYVPLYLTPKTVWRVEEACKAAGVEYALEEVATATGMTENIELEETDFVGTLFRATCAHREYQGKPQEDWKKFVVSPLAAPVAAAPAPVTTAIPAPVAAVATAAVQQAVVTQAAEQAAAVGTVRRRRVAS